MPRTDTAATEERDGDFIQMYHPDMKDAAPARTTVKAFREVWEAKGWKRLSSKQVEEAAAAAAVAKSQEV